jgi:rhodanese-related sulfurtransferase
MRLNPFRKPPKPVLFSWDSSAPRQALTLFVFSFFFAVLFNAYYNNGIPLKYAPPQLPHLQDIVKDHKDAPTYPGWKKPKDTHKPSATPTVPSPTSSIPRLSLIGIKDRFDRKSAIFLDAREPAAYEEGHIPGALNFSALELDKFAPLVMPQLTDKNQEIIAYCNGGDCTLSLDLARTLIEQGYKKVEVFEDGWPTWKKAGYPVGTGVAP